jgi:hypothetical protein
VRDGVGSDLRYSVSIEKIAIWLEKAMDGKRGFTVALTSVNPAEGVTHLVIDLVHHFSNDRGKKVVTVDLAGMGSLIKDLGADDERLLGDPSNLHPVDSGKSFVLSERGLPARMDEKNIRSCLASVASQADIVFIDAPHILEEGFMPVAGAVNAVIVVMDLAVTSRREAAAAVAGMKKGMKKVSLGELGMVINRGGAE